MQPELVRLRGNILDYLLLAILHDDSRTIENHSESVERAKQYIAQRVEQIQSKLNITVKNVGENHVKFYVKSLAGERVAVIVKSFAAAIRTYIRLPKEESASRASEYVSLAFDNDRG